MGKNFIQRWFAAKPPCAPCAENPASRSIEQIAQEGDAEAQFQLGLKYATAPGRERDEIQAVAWYLKAAEQNHGLAQLNLGQMFACGNGVTRDAVRSLFWFRRAANMGIADAQFYMGQVCQRAGLDGSEADAPEARIEAYKWFELAAAQKYPSALGVYAQLALRMSWEEVAEARRRVKGWIPEFSPAFQAAKP